MRDLSALKEAAKPFLPLLAERAGFRPARIKNKFHCNQHDDNNPSVHLYPWGLRRFCCGDSLDIISIAALAVDGSTADGIRELEALCGFQAPNQNNRPRFTAQELGRAEQFKTGLLWHIEECLEAFKQAFWDGSGTSDPISELTQLQAEARSWNAYQSAEAFQSMMAADSTLTAELILNVEAFQELFALFIRCVAEGTMEAAA